MPMFESPTIQIEMVKGNGPTTYLLRLINLRTSQDDATAFLEGISHLVGKHGQRFQIIPFSYRIEGGSTRLTEILAVAL